MIDNIWSFWGSKKKKAYFNIGPWKRSRHIQGKKNALTHFHKKCKLVGKKNNHSQVLGVGSFGVS